MEGKIIMLLYTVSLIYISDSQMPNFNGNFPMPDFGGYTTEGYDNDNGGWEFGGYPGETSAVLHNDPVTINVKIGSDVKLPCHVTNHESLIVSWSFLKTNKKLTKGNKVIANKRHYGIDITHPGEWNLLVNDVRHDDAGEYVCLLQSLPPQMKSVYLVVKAPPRIQKSSLKEIYKVMEGQPINITCEAVGSPLPVVQWYSYRTNPKTFMEEKKLFSNNSSLQIDNLKRSDGGIYRCEATNNHGTDLYEIVIEAKYAPEPASTTTEILVKYGSAATLDCVYYSSPRAQIEWRKGGKKLWRNWKYNIDTYKDEKLQGSELTIRSTDAADNGKYKCIATNTIGTQETIFTVLVVELTTTTQSTTTSPTTTPTTTTILSPTRPTTRHRPPVIIISTQNSTPGEIVNPTTERSVDPPKTAQSQNGASCSTSSVKLVFISLTFLITYITTTS